MKEMICEKLEQITNDLQELNNNTTIDKRTKILNIEHRLGEYNAYWICLQKIDVETAVKMHEKSKDIKNRSLQAVSDIYKLY